MNNRVKDDRISSMADYNQYKWHGNDGGGGGGGGGEMLESRVAKLEQDLTSLKVDISVIKSNYATREDLHKEIGIQTKWIAATIIATTSIALAMAKYLFA